MARTLSATSIKRNRPYHQRDAPAPGTKLRRWWDKFHADPGRVFQVEPSEKRELWDTTHDLREYYGLDIRCVKRGRRGPSYWVLAGEWMDRGYRDYIAERHDGSGLMVNTPAGRT